MMAQTLDIAPKSLRRWERRSRKKAPSKRRRGRREVIPIQTRWLLRLCYLEHYRQWGPSVLAEWAARTGLGRFSPTTIGRAIADLKPPRTPRPKPRRYTVASSNVMWSEVGLGFRERGRKHELLAVQDEHSRRELNHRLVAGPAQGDDVVAYLEQAFREHGAPLVLKQDLGSNLNSDPVRQLCDRYGVLILNSPAGYPPYNGRRERANRDIRQYVNAMRKDGPYHPLSARIDAAIHDLSNVRPRPMLKGRTAREVYEADKRKLPNRWQLIKEVNALEQRIKQDATDRAELDCARRRAIESVLLSHRLMKYGLDVETNFSAERVTA
jgi:hypothetical protein